MIQLRSFAIWLLVLGILVVCSEGSEQLKAGEIDDDFSDEGISAYPNENEDFMVTRRRREVPKSVRDQQKAERVLTTLYNAIRDREARITAARTRQLQQERLRDHIQRIQAELTTQRGPQTQNPRRS